MGNRHSSYFYIRAPAAAHLCCWRANLASICDHVGRAYFYMCANHISIDSDIATSGNCIIDFGASLSPLATMQISPPSPTTNTLICVCSVCIRCNLVALHTYSLFSFTRPLPLSKTTYLYLSMARNGFQHTHTHTQQQQQCRC